MALRAASPAAGAHFVKFPRPAVSELLRFVPHLLVVAFAIGCAVALRADLQQVSLGAMLHASNLIAAAAVLSVLNYVMRITRWRWYLARLGHELPLLFTALTYIAGFAYTLSPGKVGELVRARYYVPLGISVPKVAAAFFAERLLDLISMIFLAVMLLASSSHYRPLIVAVCGCLLLVLVLVAALPWERIATAVESMQWLPALLRRALLSVTSAVSATRPLLRPIPLAVGCLLGLLAWGLEGVGFSVLAGAAPAVHIDTSMGIGIYAVAVLVGALSFLPGGLGSTEAVMSTLLISQGFATGDAIFITLACRVVTLWLGVLLGWLAVLSLRNQPLTVASQ